MILTPLWLSFRVAFLATVLASCAGIGLGTLLARRRFFGRDLLDAVLTAPMVLPPTVFGYYLLRVLGRSSALGRAFESATGTSIVFTSTGAVIAAAIAAFPFVMKASRAAIEQVDVRVISAAQTLGASPVRVLSTIVLPLAKRGIVAGMVLGFSRALGEFGITLMIGGNLPGATQTGALAIYDAVLRGSDAQAASLSVLMTALATLLLYAIGKLLLRDRHGA